MNRHALIPPGVLLAMHWAFAGAGPVSVSQAWVRAGPPSISVYAGYLMLNNRSNQTQTIVAVSSPRFAKVEIHRTQIENGIARMVKQSELVLAPNGILKLEPGGLHLMLIDPNGVLELNERIPVQLEFANGASMNSELTVRAAPPDT